MPIPLYDRFHLYITTALVCGGIAMMAAAWLLDSL
ncbi:hypothetical protein SAMN05216360_12336 [Methylobacterium phyllostachyos]|uniref:Uncharacterized protein n=1 Tax=Methylobacterium phyllostachyos TaxID=582672 RepID=A0A1H0JPI3_9HYPH|nr:hypothetical protein SAMN05216360_12336 [Methylobacterium phyllostachyos]